MTPNELRIKAYHFNEKYFNNRIDLLPIQFRISNRMIRGLGTYSVTRQLGRIVEQKITISSVLLEDEEALDNTLIHEMIHAEDAQYNDGKYSSHGYFFKKRAYEIGKLGIDITRLAKVEATSAVGQAVEAKRNSRASTKSQWIVFNKRGDQFNVIRKLTSSEVELLKKKGQKVMIPSTPLPRLQHTKNFMFLTRWTSYYPETLISSKAKEVGATLREV